ncbi:hypothetical protein CYY_009404 [Polysphondylium violaceum]|uniref:Ankyrin repeat-containing protein n=1 Tax=Polysphondylium violaceum TaxID=133409 RepID=A0A8J4PLL4_9MYCE|nr:hypothetical protein CYY_009404 [Polysphondylium violaceum]
MDDLFRQIFFNPTLNENIFHHVVHDVNYRTINYKYCLNFSWLIKNQYFELLRTKSNNDEYILLYQERKKDIFKITDLELFILCFKMIRDVYNNSSMEIGALEYCAKYNNWNVVKYLINQKYAFKSGFFLECAAAKGNQSMVKLFCQHAKVSLRSQAFLNAVSSRDRDIVGMVFKHFREEFNRQLLQDREDILVAAMETGDLELFKIVKNQFKRSFTFYRLRTIFHKPLLWRLYGASMKNFDTYKYLYEHFGTSLNPNAAKTGSTNISPSKAVEKCSAATSASPSATIHPFVFAATHGSDDIIQHAMEKKLINKNTMSIAALSEAALLNGHFDLYKTICKNYNSSITPSTAHLGKMSSLPTSIDQVIYMVENLRLPYCKYSIQRSASHSTEIFKYLYEKSFGQWEFSSDLSFINHIIAQGYKENNIEVIHYLSDKGVCFANSNLWSDLVKLDPNQCYKLLYTLFSIQPPTYSDLPLLIKALEYFSQHSRNVNVFKLVYHQVVHELSYDPLDLSQLLSLAAKGGRLQTFIFLFQQGVRPYGMDYLKLLEEASLYGSLQIMKYIIQNYFNTLYLNPNIIENAIKHNHYNIIDYLIPFYPNYTSQDPNFLEIKEMFSY